jgi:hypothetical protein
MSDKLLQQLNDEMERLAKEYSKLKNRPKPFETEDEKGARDIQIEYDKQDKRREFDSFDFEKKRAYVLKLRKEVEFLRLTERKDELEQKLKDRAKDNPITEIELSELQALNNILFRERHE